MMASSEVLKALYQTGLPSFSVDCKKNKECPLKK